MRKVFLEISRNSQENTFFAEYLRTTASGRFSFYHYFQRIQLQKVTKQNHTFCH